MKSGVSRVGQSLDPRYRREGSASSRRGTGGFDVTGTAPGAPAAHSRTRQLAAATTGIDGECALADYVSLPMLLSPTAHH